MLRIFYIKGVLWEPDWIKNIKLKPMEKYTEGSKWAMSSMLLQENNKMHN